MKEQNKENNGKGNRNSKFGNFLHAIIALSLIAYLVVALSLSADIRSNRICRGIKIDVRDTTSLKFVKSTEIAKELGSLVAQSKGSRILDINTDSIERVLNGIDKIEKASVVRLSDGYILITVDPMHPVMRVFDGADSYYINQQGKRISADARYHVDVPVVIGHFTDSTFQAIDLMPLVDYISADSLWNSVVSVIKVDSPTDVLLVPIIKGHVINFGSPDRFKDKFSRLRRMYSNVLPVKGWEHYDTISVKWAGQVVATRRHKKVDVPLRIIEEDEDSVDVGTMLADEGVAPGQSLAGRKANSEKPIPAATQPQKTTNN
ncbi:MAG: hypothetical protein J1E38_01000 [Paramuribaculum sp.]|nr:hypothetical protein [Paramuribaculum sp.]